MAKERKRKEVTLEYLPEQDLTIFISYAIEDQILEAQLESRISSLFFEKVKFTLLTNRGDSNSPADVMASADIILLLISESYLDSRHQKTIDFAMRMNEEGKKVTPILIKECKWNDQPFAELEILPDSREPLSSFADKDEALSSIVLSIRYLMGEVLYRKQPNVRLAFQIIEEEKERQTGRLDISNHGLREIPEEVFEFEWLVELITGDGKSIQQKRDLENVNIITAVPDKISRLGKLKSLVMNNNRLSATTNIGTLHELEKLELGNNLITEVEGWESLNRLTAVNLSGNRITNITGLQGLQNLVSLDISGNQISDLAPLAKLRSLKSLDAYNNKIEDVSCLKKLVNLEYLRLSTNKIKDITSLATLTGLTWIRLSENQIEDLSPLFGHIQLGLTFVDNINPEKQQISVAHNPLKVPNISYILGGRETQLAFIQSFKEKLKFSHSNILKVILLGNSNCGKTTLRKFLANDHDYKEQLTTRRLEIEKIKWKIEGRNELMELRILDFGGQEYFHGTYPLFFSLETLYVVLWTVEENKYKLEESREITTDKNDKCVLNEDFDVGYWLNSIEIITGSRDRHFDIRGEAKLNSFEENEDVADRNASTNNSELGHMPVSTQGKDIPVLLIQNKVDLDGFAYEDIKTFSRTFTRFNIDTISVSLLSGLRLEMLKNILHQKIIETNAHQREVPNKWLEVLDLLKQEHLENPIISYDDFSAIARRIFDDTVKYSGLYLKGIARYFHATHEFIYFDNITTGVIVLDTEWFINTIYKLISAETILKYRGLITENSLQEITGTKFSKASAFIEILKANNILFEHQETGVTEKSFIFPQMLPSPEIGPDKLLYSSFEHANVIILFKFYLHRATIQALYGLLEPYNGRIDYKFLYKNGLVVQKGKGMIFIEIIQNHKQIAFKTTKQSVENDAFIREIIFEVLTDTTKIDYKLLNRLPIGMDDPELCIQLNKGIGNLIPIKRIQTIANDAYYSKKVSTISFENNFYDLIDFAPYRYLMDQNVIMPLRLFISYAHKDLSVFTIFASHLSNLKNEGLISVWHDQMLLAGDKWDNKILAELRSADIVIFLISQDFINSKYIQEKEFKETYDQVKTVIPIKVRSCNFSYLNLKDDQFANVDPLIPSADLEDKIVKVINAIRDKIGAIQKTNVVV